jgi:hypothetical protein
MVHRRLLLALATLGALAVATPGATVAKSRSDALYDVTVRLEMTEQWDFDESATHECDAARVPSRRRGPAPRA